MRKVRPVIAWISLLIFVLVARPAEREQAQQAYSSEYLWQLRHRVRKKLERFILGTST